jgi:hypothetical protein
LAIVAVICADTPKSAILKKQKTNKEKWYTQQKVKIKLFMVTWEETLRNYFY